MARKAEGGISFVDGKGYRVTIGKTQGADGVERYRTWWLGHDRGFARYAARELRDCWEFWLQDGNKHWQASRRPDTRLICSTSTRKISIRC